MKGISFALLGAGFFALLANLLHVPLILGYILGGLLVGPSALGIVPSHEEIGILANLGEVFLLFMLGLELNVIELLKMGKVAIMTGMLQFPICIGLQAHIFVALTSAGISLGAGKFAALYCALGCGISSTMIVTKLLKDKMELESQDGRVTLGVLIFQDIWAIIILAIQPNMTNPDILGMIETFSMMAVLMVVAYLYAKFVMPAVFLKASSSVELMLVIALSWCFFVGCIAILPFMGLSLEVGALISGAILATFPYSGEFNGKIKYLRDFFVALFFVSVGMQIPSPTGTDIGTGFLVALLVLVIRWFVVTPVIYMSGGDGRLACLATLNLSGVSEISLIIASLGVSYGHLEQDTLIIMCWVFFILAIPTPFFIKFNHKITNVLLKATAKCFKSSDEEEEHDVDDDGSERDIVFLGFHRVASMLVSEFQKKNAGVLAKINVIDINEDIKPKLEKKGVMFSKGDITSPDIWKCQHADVRICLSTIPDSVLQGITNKQICENALKVWPGAMVIATAESHDQKQALYDVGASYVLVQTQLCAERLQGLVGGYITDVNHDGELKQIINKHLEDLQAGNKRKFADSGPKSTAVYD